MNSAGLAIAHVTAAPQSLSAARVHLVHALRYE